MANENNAEQTLDETLNKTDFGQIVNENKKPILIAGIGIVIAIFSYSMYKQSAKSQLNLTLSNAHSFKTKVVDGYTSKKIKADEFISQMNAMPSSLKGEVSILPSVLGAVKVLSEEGKLEDSAKILESWKSNFSENSFAYFFTAFNLAQVYDDLNRKDDALDLLGTLKKSSIKILKAKVLLDIARLQLETNRKEESKANLEIIINDYKDSSEAKEAKFFLTQLN